MRRLVIILVALVGVLVLVPLAWAPNLDPGSGGYWYHNTYVPCGSGRTIWYEYVYDTLNAVVCALYPPYYW